MRELRSANLSSPALLASLDEPRARERTVTEDVSPHGARVLTKRCWQRRRSPAAYAAEWASFPSTLESSIVIRSRTVAIVWGIAFEGPHSSGRIAPAW